MEALNPTQLVDNGVQEVWECDGDSFRGEEAEAYEGCNDEPLVWPGKVYRDHQPAVDWCIHAQHLLDRVFDDDARQIGRRKLLRGRKHLRTSKRLQRSNSRRPNA
jgi:hypothetical protein